MLADVHAIMFHWRRYSAEQQIDRQSGQRSSRENHLLRHELIGKRVLLRHVDVDIGLVLIALAKIDCRD